MLMLHHLAEERIGPGHRRKQRLEAARFEQAMSSVRSLGNGVS